MPQPFSICQLFVGLIFVCAAVAQEPEATNSDVFRSGGIEFSFADVDQGRQSLGRRDPFVDQMSPFDRQVRMQAAQDPGVNPYLAFVAGEASAQ